MQSDYNEEVVQLCDNLARKFPSSNPMVIEPAKVDEVFLQSQKHFTPALGGIDWTKARELGFWRSDEVQRIPGLIEEALGMFYSHLAIDDENRVKIVSDDLYECGIEINAAYAIKVINDWIPLAHAIFLFTNDLTGVFHVSFVRDIHCGVAAHLNRRRTDLQN